MHNNGLIKFFAFCFTLVSIYQISFTFITSNVETKATEYSINSVSDLKDNYADLREEKYTSFLDSLSEKIGLNKDSNVMLIGCEGDTDQKMYQKLISQ